MAVTPDGLGLDPKPGEKGKPVPRLDAAGVREMAQGIVTNQYFVGSQAPVDLWPMIFLPIGLGALADVDIDTLGMVVEEWSRAGDRGINGFPIFMSCKLVHVDDWAAVDEKVAAAVAALGVALGNEGDQ